MVSAAQPFCLPHKLPPSLATIHRRWRGLIRAENRMPFSDDISVSRLGGQTSRLMLVDVFSTPQRFRFSRLGEGIIARFGGDISGQFADELKLGEPFDYLLAQAAATVEAAAPTFYSTSPPRQKKRRRGDYARIMLPAWGNGRVDLIVGAVG